MDITACQNYYNLTSTVLKDKPNIKSESNINIFYNDYYELDRHEEKIYKTVDTQKKTLSYINNLNDEEELESIINSVSLDNCIKLDKNLNSNTQYFELTFELNKENEYSFGYLDILSSEKILEIKDGLTMEYLKTIDCQLVDDSVEISSVFYGSYKFEDFKRKNIKILFPKANKNIFVLFSLRFILVPFQKIKEEIFPNNILSLLFPKEKLNEFLNKEKLNEFMKKDKFKEDENLIKKNFFDLNQPNNVVDLIEKRKSKKILRKRKPYAYKNTSNKLILKKLNDLEKKIDFLNNKISSLNL